jgi:hypothetical protein
LIVPFSDCITAEDERCLVEKISVSENVHIRRIRENKCLDHLAISPRILCSNNSISNVYNATVRPHLSNNPLWSVRLMMSRCFGYLDSGIAYVPLADQFNHSTLEFHTRIRQEQDAYVFYAESRIEKNREIFSNYGIDSEIEMFVSHGFVDAGMLDSFVYLRLGEGLLVKVNVKDPAIFPPELNVYDNRALLVRLLADVVDGMIDSTQQIDLRALSPVERTLVGTDLKNLKFFKSQLALV